jgi:glycosyltransferase involved in cell wall biosynthesis
MRVALIAPPWLAVPPPAYGGTELVLDNLCRGLAAAGHDVLLYTTGDSTCPVERAWTFERHLGTVLANPAAELRHVMDAYDAALAWGADVIHDHADRSGVGADPCPHAGRHHEPRPVHR